MTWGQGAIDRRLSRCLLQRSEKATSPLHREPEVHGTGIRGPRQAVVNASAQGSINSTRGFAQPLRPGPRFVSRAGRLYGDATREGRRFDGPVH